MISLDKFNGNCNAVDGLSTKICVLSKTKDSNVEVFNMITKIKRRKNIGKTYFMFKFNTKSCNSNQKWNNVSVKSIACAKRIIVGILADVFVRTVGI